MKKLFPCDLVSPVCYYLVGIHVRLGSGTCLPNHQREVIIKLSFDNLVAGLFYSLFFLRRHFFRTKLVISNRRSFF